MYSKLRLYAIVFPPIQYPRFWKSIQRARELRSEYKIPPEHNNRFEHHSLVCEVVDVAYLNEDDYKKEKISRGQSESLRNKKKCQDEVRKLSKELATKIRKKLSSIRSIGGVLKDARNSGRAMATQPSGFVQGTMMRDYQKMSLSFLLDLELGKSSGIYEFIKHSSSGEVLQYFPGSDIFRLYKNNSSYLLGPRRGGMLCDEMGLGKTVVSLALIMANPPPGSEFQKRLGHAPSPVIIEEVEEKIEDEDEEDVEMKIEDDDEGEEDSKESIRDKLKKTKSTLKSDRCKRDKILDKIYDRTETKMNSNILLGPTENEIMDPYDLLDKNLIGLQVDMTFPGYGTKKWRGIVASPAESSNANKNQKYDVEWIEDKSVSFMTGKEILKHVVLNEGVNDWKKICSARLILGMIGKNSCSSDEYVWGRVFELGKKKNLASLLFSLFTFSHLTPYLLAHRSLCLCCLKDSHKEVYCTTCLRYFHVKCIGSKVAATKRVSSCLRCEIASSIDAPIGVVEKENSQNFQSSNSKGSSIDSMTEALSCTLVAVLAAKDALKSAYKCQVEVVKAETEKKLSVIEEYDEDDDVEMSSTMTTTTTTTTTSTTLKKNMMSPSQLTTINETWINGEMHHTGRVKGGTLVVCALSLVGQWQEEAKKFCSDKVKICAYHGGNRCKDPMKLSGYDIVVTTYQTIGSDCTNRYNKKTKKWDLPVGSDTFARVRVGKKSPCHGIAWYRVIVDESHFIKNSKAKMSRATTSFFSKHSLLVTGTPINSSMNDIVGQTKIFQIDDVTADVCLIDNEKCQSFFRKGVSNNVPIGLIYLLRNLMIRHEKDQYMNGKALLTLPPKTESVCYIDWPDAKIRKSYFDAEKRARDIFISCANDKIINRSTIRLFGALLPLRMFCSLGVEASKTTVGGEETCYCHGSCWSSIHKISDCSKLTCGHIHCSTCLKEAELRKECCKCHKALDVDEIVPLSSTRTDPVLANGVGVKIKLLIKELSELRRKDKTAKVLIFSQFVKTLDVLKLQLEKIGLKYRTLTGDMSLAKRKKALNMFQKDPPTTVFLLSIRAGAVGINLTQANFVMLLDACTNPALEAQAIGRVWRLGQKRKVHIRRYIMKDSIESRILEMEKEKNRKHTNTTTTTSNDDDQKMNVVDDDVIDLSSTAVAGSIMSNTQRFRVNEFMKLFDVENKDVPEQYRIYDPDKKSKSKSKSKKRQREEDEDVEGKEEEEEDPTKRRKTSAFDDDQCVIS